MLNFWNLSRGSCNVRVVVDLLSASLPIYDLSSSDDLCFRVVHLQ